MTNHGYRSAYRTFKKSPTINFIITIILSFIWAFYDLKECITDLDFGCLVVWPLAGLALGFIIKRLTMIAISPIVVQTDAICELVDLAKQ